MSWPEYVRRLARGDNQVAIERTTGVRQSTVSRWLKGQTTPTPAEAAKFAQGYRGNVLEAFVAAGLLTEEEAGLPPKPRVTFSDVIDADPDLSAEAKVHIKNQYGLLKAASANNRAVLLREQIERSETLDDETRAQLLATLNGGSDTAVALTVEAYGHEEVRSYPHVVQQAARENTGQDRPAEPDPNVDPPGPEGGA